MIEVVMILLGRDGTSPSPTCAGGCGGLQARAVKGVVTLLQWADVQLVPCAQQLEPACPLLWFAVGTQDDADPQGSWGGTGGSTFTPTVAAHLWSAYCMEMLLYVI
jgi:hypothetical protein